MAKTLQDVVKAVGSIGAHFKKKAEHHDKLAELHKSRHEFVKAKAESMDDCDVHKAYFAKCAEHHLSKSALHKAHGDALREAGQALEAFAAEEDAEKTAAQKAAAAATPNPPVAPAAGDGAAPGVDSMIKETTTGLVKASLEMLRTDPTVKEELRKMLLDGIRAELGDKIIPDNVRTVLPAAPAGAGLKMVSRAGGPEIDTSEVDASLAKFVEV